MKPLNEYLPTFLKTAILSLITFLSPISGLLMLVGFCVLSDTLLAVYTTIKLHGYHSFKSHKLFNIVIKSFFYLGSIFLAFLVDKYVIHNNTIFGIDLLISKITAIFWVYIEFKSMDETSQKLGNKPLVVLIKEILVKAKEIKKDINEIV